MSKKVINQKTNYNNELLNSIESKFIFNKTPINRVYNYSIEPKIKNINKTKQLNILKEEIDTIKNCSLKNSSPQIIFGEGNINSPLMIIGESPGIEEISSKKLFMGEAGNLLRKMLIAINIKIENVYSTYAVNFRIPADRKPTSREIKRYSEYLEKHISIINPKIIILMGSTAMEALTGLNNRISFERGKWKEIIVKNKCYNTIITFNPSYLLKVPENKKYSWEDLKKIKKKIEDLNLKV
ncbi:MAG: uracil-DNA glycosylase [Candidatus Pelagibacter sp. TMED106]|jgi:uracil-DNA glycosylase family 4|nr:MAG: uracil-DNA glycosylase [Candidatus Pelagibacter sp. TMED106]|tara:strand:- start:134 stop:853 length:720 start_codon:yes stop_codon:yes gene_type:complete